MTYPIPDGESKVTHNVLNALLAPGQVSLQQQLHIGSGGGYGSQQPQVADQFRTVVYTAVAHNVPTIDPSSRPFLLVSLEDYQRYVQRIPGGFLKPPEEAWVALKDTADRRQTALSLEEHLTGFVSSQDRDAVADRAERNPLAGGSWNGLTLLGIFSLSVAVVLALAIHTAVAVHTGRLDLSLTRALGFSRGQLFLSLSLERIIVAVVGIAAGSAIGIWLGRWVLGFLDITASGQAIIPPMVFTVQEWLIALVFVNLMVASLLALLFATLSARRLRVPEVLRTGE